MTTKSVTKLLTFETELLGIFLCGVFLFCGCSKNESPINNDEDVLIQFKSILQSAPTWERELTENTLIGIFILSSGTMLPNGIISESDNMEYRVSNTELGTLISKDNLQIHYPQTGNTDFIAYYPYGEKGSSEFQITNQYTYNISVSNQINPIDIDVLYAKTTDIVKSNEPISLTFNHVLSKITLNLKAGNGVTASDISELTKEQVALNGMPIKATLSLQDGSLAVNESAPIHPLKANTPVINYDATFSAIIIPHTADEYSSRTLILNINNKEYTWNIPASEVFNKGSHYTYPVTVNESGLEVGIPMQIPIETVQIPAGTFMMGSPTSEGGYLNETQHAVTLTRNFYMSKYEITNSQYAEFLNAVGIGDNGIWTDGQYPDEKLIEEHSEEGLVYNNNVWKPVVNKENNPVINVTWYGATEFARWVGGSLPTEAQWEYACRAETTTPYPFGNDLSVATEYVWYNTNASYQSHPVGEKKPNSWGLFDMLGNVGEWCLDSWDGTTAYSQNAITDPVSPAPGDYRINRGGSWQYYITRSAFRSYSSPYRFLNRIGFRVAFVY